MTGLVSRVCMMYARRIEGYLHDRGLGYGAMYAWRGVAKCLMIYTFEDVLAAAFLIYSLC